MATLPTVSELAPALALMGFKFPDAPAHVSGYGDSEELCEGLLALIVSGRKRAGTGLLWAHEYESEPIPEAGAIEIVVDHLHRPRLVARLLNVWTVPFNEVSAEYAAIEGEGDGSLDYWQQAHWAFFSRECARIGKVPTPSMPVVCSTFELLFVVPAVA